MQWQEEGLIISQTPVGEQGILLSTFTPTHGIYKGFLKKTSLRKSPFLQPGNIALFTWKARLQDHLGFWTQLEQTSPSMLSHFLSTKEKLFALSSILSLLENFLPERDPHPELYKNTNSLIQTIALSSKKNWMISYLEFEMALLKEIGYGLDLEKCAVTGKKENLRYISPKTGCAVTEEGAGVYKDKLFSIPSFFLEYSKNAPERFSYPLISDIFKGLQITSHFLHKALEHTSTSYRPKSLPETRLSLQRWFEQSLE